MQHNKWAAHAAVVILLFAAAAFGAGQVSVMDPITKLPKYLKGGVGIDVFSNGELRATGVAVPISIQPWSNISTASRGNLLRPTDSGRQLTGVVNDFHYQASDFINNPILHDTSYNRRDPSRILKVSGTYYVYYTKAANIPVIPGGQIWYATAPAITGPWTEQGLALDKGTGTDWDSNAVYTPDVVESGGTYYLFYSGQSTAYAPFDSGYLGVATSNSPAGPFTKSASNPIISPVAATWKSRLVDAAYPLKMPDGSWRLYYKGRNSTGRQIGYATATAGGFPNVWTDYSSNPIFGNGVNGSPSGDCENGEPLLINGRYYMLTQVLLPSSALESTIWYESANGATNWVKSMAFESIAADRVAGAWNDAEAMGAKVAPLEGDLSYIVTNGAPDGTSKIGLGLYLLTRTAGDKPIVQGMTDSGAINKDAGASITASKNGTRFSLLTGSEAYNLVQLNADGKLPAVDGSLLTGLPSGMDWPTGAAGVPNYSGTDSWAATYNATNRIPNSFVVPFDNISGNAATASALATPRTINGVTFDGTDNITVYDSTKAPTLSPAFTGNPTAPTAATNTNSTQIATTAFVLGQSGTNNPTMNGIATPGTSFLYSRQDHVHATDTSRAPLASPTFTGTVGGITKAMVGLSDVDNTSDATKAVLTATKLATSRTINGVSFDGSANITVADSTKEPTITAGTTADYWRGDKSWQALNQASVSGLTTADGPTFAGVKTSSASPSGLLIRNTNSTFNSVLSAGNVGNPTLIANWEWAGTQSDASKPSWGINMQINNDKIIIQRAPAGSTTFAQILSLWGSGGGGLGITVDPGAGNFSVLNYIVSGYEEKTTSYTVSKDSSKITLASSTAVVTLPKTLPAGDVYVTVTVAGAAASGVSLAAESGGSMSWGDAGAPTFANNKTADVVCHSQNAAATTTAAWRCVKGGDF